MTHQRTDLFPQERLAKTVALSQLQRGATPGLNTAYICVVALDRITRNMQTDPCQHDSITGQADGGSRCEECGEWFE